MEIITMRLGLTPVTREAPGLAPEGFVQMHMAFHQRRGQQLALAVELQLPVVEVAIVWGVVHCP